MKREEQLRPSSLSKIVTRMLKVQKAADRAARSKDRFAEYKYLRSVLRAHEYFSDNNLLKNLAEIAPSELMTPVRANWHPLRLIIDASCKQPDMRMRSRWTRALEYAVARNVSPDDLPRFIRANGGIAGCADLASKIKLRRSESRVGVLSVPERRIHALGQR